MSAQQLVELLESYARKVSAPLRLGATVMRVTAHQDRYIVETSRGAWQTRVVVIATGHCDTPHIPRIAGDLPKTIHQLPAARYRNPAMLPSGSVIVVGASSSGLQIARELAASGRRVTLAVGQHVRVPRRYKGHDIMWWLDRTGILDERSDQVADINRSRQQPSLQLTGRPDMPEFDLAGAQKSGIALAGRLIGLNRHHLCFRNDLDSSVAAAELKLKRLLQRIDACDGRQNADSFVRCLPSIDTTRARPELGVADGEVQSIIWATGYRRNYAWLKLPVVNLRGELNHQGGVTTMPGLYAVGLNFMRRRKSTFLDGVGRDAEELVAHIQAYLHMTSVRRFNGSSAKYHVHHHERLNAAAAG